MRVLIVGCGDVGCELGRRLHDDGGAVWGLRRNVAALPPEIQPVAADLSRPETLQDLPKDLDAVVYTVAAGGRSEDAYRAAYVDGLENTLQALQEQGQRPRRLIFVSSTGVYGQDDGSWVDESSPTEPTSFTGKILLEAERKALSGPYPATVARLSGIYGPGRRRLIDMVASGRARLNPADRPAYTNRIHRNDCAGMLRHLLLRNADGQPLDEVYIGVDHEPADRREVYTWLAKRLGVPVPPEDEGEGAGGRRGGNKRCRNDRLVATGFEFEYASYRDGYGEMLD